MAYNYTQRKTRQFLPILSILIRSQRKFLHDESTVVKSEKKLGAKYVISSHVFPHLIE